MTGASCGPRMRKEPHQRFGPVCAEANEQNFRLSREEGRQRDKSVRVGPHVSTQHCLRCLVVASRGAK